MQRVATAIVQWKTRVIDLDLRAYFDTVRHHLLLEKVARRINDDEVMGLLKLMLTASGKQGVPQGGVISPLLSNISYGQKAHLRFQGRGVYPTEGSCPYSQKSRA